MFRADAEADEPRRDSPERWNFSQQAQGERRRERSGAAQHPGNDPALDGDLQPLRHARRPLAPLLDLAQAIDGEVSLPQRFEKNVGCRHGILDREIDADAADRRHGVSGVANAQQTRPMPIDQSVHTNS